MSDSDNPGAPDDSRPSETAPDGGFTSPSAGSWPPAPEQVEPTRQLPLEPPTEPTQQLPQQQPDPYAAAYGSTTYETTSFDNGGYQAPDYVASDYVAPDSPYAAPGYFGVPEPSAPHTHAAPKNRAPGWMWPVVCVLALVVGAVGGGVAGALVADNKQDDNLSSGGVLKVERRTAAPLPTDNSSVASVAAKLLPSTVKIVAEYKGEAKGAAGSGWVFDSEGHVITNNHVVAEAASDDGPIDVIDQNGKHHKAEVVGRSPVYDLAVLKVEGIEDLPPAAIGSADQMHVGETVVAVGSPLALSASVTSGIVSALNRPVTTGDGDDTSFINAIQTDAAINPGNSGGPLANLQGEVIGVNSAIATLGSSSGEEGTNIGIGFSIPIEQVQVTADQILRTGKAQYPVIGVTVKGSASTEGAEVTQINEDTPAADSDLQVGDVITRVDETPVTDQTDVVVAIRTHLVTDKVTLTVLRNGKERKIRVGLVAKTG